ncbi:uncharacterized protein [Penaeus vannamei]|uniref:uncharacterized protein n=1 Tax=Penaeus vannamei TaxID=6689 RepID=UPI00387F9EDB
MVWWNGGKTAAVRENSRDNNMDVSVRNIPPQGAPVHLAPIYVAPIPTAPISMLPVDEAPVYVAPDPFYYATNSQHLQVTSGTMSMFPESHSEDSRVNNMDVSVRNIPPQGASVHLAPIYVAPIPTAPIPKAPISMLPVDEAPVYVAPDPFYYA